MQTKNNDVGFSFTGLILGILVAVGIFWVGPHRGLDGWLNQCLAMYVGSLVLAVAQFTRHWRRTRRTA